MIDRRRIPSRRLQFEPLGRIAGISAIDRGLDLEGVESAGTRRDAFLSDNLRRAGILESCSEWAVDRVALKFPRIADIERQLDAQTIVWRVPPNRTVLQIPRTVVNV